MGCFQDLKPVSVGNFGREIASGQTSVPVEQIDHALYALKEGGIAEKSERKGQNDPARRREVFSLYDEFRPRLFGYIRSFRLTSDQAEEIIQEIFLRLTAELAREKKIENLEGWIIRVAHNLALDARAKIDKDANYFRDVSQEELETCIDTKEGPFESYEKEEKYNRMQAALASLTPQQRRCFRLRMEDFSYKDIGETLHISEQRAALIMKQVAVRLAGLLQVGGTKVE